MNQKRQIQAIKKNPALFEEVFEQHYKTIFNYVFRRTGNFDLARDITSESFLKAYLHIDRFKWKGVPILAWIYRIAGNETAKFYRNKKYQPELMHEVYPHLEMLYASTDLETERENAEAEWKKHKQFVAVQKSLKELDAKYQEVISLKYFEGMKIKEIAMVLNKKEGTIKSLLSRGLSQIRSKLQRNHF